MDNYYFRSERIGFRNWRETDLDRFAAMNQNEEVMQFFPKTLSEQESERSFARFIDHFLLHQFGFFAVELISNQEWIGFIGLQHVRFDSFFTPAVEVGYRLLPQHWGKGIATEGTKACIQYAFHQLQLDRVVSYTPKVNIPSQRVMQKSGMVFINEFDHPLLPVDSPLTKSVLYEIKS
jgi:ribosomal-protein-alanine N-acetyltransferase